MRNRTYGGVRGRKTKVGRKLLRFPPTRFEIELGERVTYSYKVTPGVAKNQNATYLLRQILESGQA